MEFGEIANLGVAGIAMVAVVLMIDFLRKRIRSNEKGNRRIFPEVIECPNKVEGLAKTLIAIAAESQEQTRLNTEQLKVLTHNKDGIDRLVDQHKANADGVETWKVQPRMMTLQQETRDLLKEVVAELKKKNGMR